HCFLTSIPYDISKLINLETFKAQCNELIILENVFTGLTSLKVLNLSINQITTIERSIFDIITLEKLIIYANSLELLPSNINNMRNRNLQIELFDNPLRLRLDEDPDNPELIFFEDVNQDILKNIGYDAIIMFQETGIEIKRGYTNMDLNVKAYYEELNIPADERLNLEEIKLCQAVEPGNHIKNQAQIEKTLEHIFREIDICYKEEKMNFLIRRINDYYFQDRNIIKTENPTKEYKKRNSIIDYFEFIIDEIYIMSIANKKKYAGEIIDNMVSDLNFEVKDSKDKNVTCLDGQGQIYISTYLNIIPDNRSMNAKEKIKRIITSLKEDILKKITAPGNEEEEEVEIFIKWKYILSEELGFQKETNLYAYLDKSDRTELYDKKYIVEQFFREFTLQRIRDEINKHLKIERLGNELYDQLNEYINYIYGRNEQRSKPFGIVDDGKFFQLQDEDVRKLLKPMGYLFIKKK
ncbi:Leucine rich repeat protein, partial [Spraguea lophii 42_110]